MASNKQLRLVSAPLWRRLAAMLYDGFLLLAIFFAMTAIIMAIRSVGNEGNVQAITGMERFTILFPCLFIITICFFGLFWVKSGQSLGMQTWKIELRLNDGGRISWLTTVIRCAAGLLSLAAFGLGYFIALIRKDARTLPDIMSQTTIVRKIS